MTSIKYISKCDIKTIRNIKHQLLRSNNLIDFEKFRSYELNSYKNLLKKKNKKWFNNKDAFILTISSFYSDNGLNWLKAVKNTIIVALFFYSILFCIHYFQTNYILLNTENYKIFFNGFFRFFILTDFYSPFEIKKIYINTPLEWIIFILGKIFIGIGIYEIIKSFRKYKK